MEREGVAVPARSCEVVEIPAGQVVDHGHLLAIGQQSINERGPDETCATGDDDGHRSVLRGDAGSGEHGACVDGDPMPDDGEFLQ